jgi:hypothetical protein
MFLTWYLQEMNLQERIFEIERKIRWLRYQDKQ